MIKRMLSSKMLSLARSFPVIALTGPRQSGKTTLAQYAFPKKPYALLEDPDTRDFALKDPRGFLAQFPNGAIIDEAQRAPQLFSYIQGIVDKKAHPGMFVLTGSQNFLLMEKISQSLAGRVALLTLLPLSFKELAKNDIHLNSPEEYIFRGFYPRLYDQDIPPRDLYANYVHTYIERDIRLLKNVHDLSVFHTFLKMCAARVGQLVNLSSLANDCGITHNTAKAWLGLLGSSYIIYLLRPHHKNFNKRLVKMPKLYFYDTGLACYLAEIKDARTLAHHPFKGALFESLIITEILKGYLNAAEDPGIYFWRDKMGHEIDCLIDHAGQLTPVEIKSGKTVSEDFFKNIKYWSGIADIPHRKGIVVYGGEASQRRSNIEVLRWKEFLSS